MSLSRILSSEPLPIAPSGLSPAMEKYLRDLHAYLIRLQGKLTAENLITEIIDDLLVNPTFVDFSGSFVGGIKIVGYNSAFFGADLFYDNGGSPAVAGATPDDYLSECEVWNGTFPFTSGATGYTAGWAVGNSMAPGPTHRQFKINTGTGTYTQIHSGLTLVGIDGNDWFMTIAPWLDSTLKYNHQIVYKKTTTASNYPPPMGTYTLTASSDPAPKTSSKFDGVGNSFPATLELELF